MAQPTLMYGRKYQKGWNWVTAIAMAAFHVGAVAAFFFVTPGAVLAAFILYFVGGVRWLGFVNYLFVWAAISLLGYAWLDDRFSSRRMLLLCAALALAVLVSLVLGGPYPVSMVGDPAEPVSNTTPPKVTLIALAIVQGGVLFALQPPARLASRTASPASATRSTTMSASSSTKGTRFEMKVMNGCAIA